jgi:hypothetical protein
MTDGVPTPQARASVPDIGPSVPTATLHLLWFAVGAGLCLLVLESPLWLAIGLLLAITGMLVPHLVPTWWLMLLLGLSPLGRAPSVSDVTFSALLAGVHLLHVIGSLTRLLPWDGRMQVVALTPSLKRFVLVQAVVQPVAVAALFAFGGKSGTVPWLPILAAAVLGIAVAVLARGLRQVRVRG